MKFGIFHNDKSLARTSFTDATSEKDVVKEWKTRYSGTTAIMDYHIGVLNEDTMEEKKR